MDYVWVVIFADVVNACDHYDFQPVAVIQQDLHHGSREIAHPGAHNALNVDMF